MMGMTGESMSPSTRQPILSRPSRNLLELSRSEVIRDAANPAAEGSLDERMIKFSADRACWAAGGDMAGE